MTTDPVQEARDEVLATAHDVHTDAQLIVALDAYAAAIRREDAERVLPLLEEGEWPIYDPVYGDVVRLVTDLRALVKEGEDD